MKICLLTATRCLLDAVLRNLSADLTTRPPWRFVILPRVLDKCRTVIAGTQGEYDYGCTRDKWFHDLAGLDA